MSIKLKMCVFIACVVTTSTFVNAVQAMNFNLIDLGTLGGTSSTGSDINDSAQVTGSSRIADGSALHSYLYDNGNMQDIGTLDDMDSYGTGINSNSQITGYSEVNSATAGVFFLRAFLYHNGIMQNIGTLPTSLDSLGYDINDKAEITGRITYGNPGDLFIDTSHAFFFDGVSMHDLGTLGGQHSFGYGINDVGYVTGWSDVEGDSLTLNPSSPVTHAFVYDGISMQSIGTLGGKDSYGRDINNSGHVTGHSDITGDGASHAFYYDGTTMKDIGTLGGDNSVGLGINESGQVVGQSQLAGSFDYVAFLYDGNNVHDLCELTDCKTNGWSSLDSASSINESGDITGSGKINGETHAFLISVVSISAVPVAFDDNASVAVNTATVINVIANDIDIEDGSPPLAPPAVVTLTTATSKQGFDISASANGTITYTPTGGFIGTDYFKYTLTDSDGKVSTPATVNITVSADSVSTVPVTNDNNNDGGLVFNLFYLMVIFGWLAISRYKPLFKCS